MKNSKPLKNLKILITRPAHQAKLLCKTIRKLGGKPILFPTLEIIDPLDRAPLRNIMQRLEDFDIAIFTSANAVSKTMSLWPKKKLSIAVAAIGPATVKALATWELPATIVPKSKFNSEALLGHSALQQVRNKKTIIFTGEGGRNLLNEELTRRGAEVTKIVTYRRVKPNIDATLHVRMWQQQGIDVIVSTSSESLQNLAKMVGKKNHTWLLSTALIVISTKMRELAENLGFTKILPAENATDEAILAVIKKWYSKTMMDPSLRGR